MRRLALVVLSLAAADPLHAQFEGFANQGLVGVGRIPANTLDAGGQDTLGGLFSAMAFNQGSLALASGPGGALTYSGIITALPDRGFGDGATDYHPRFQTLGFSFTPNYTATAANPAPQSQISFANTASTVFNYGAGTPFTGFDANGGNPAFPQSAANSAGGGRRSLDPEGIARAADGSYYVSDEYGPFIYKFSAAGALVDTITPPAAWIPRNAAGTPSYTGASAPASGRYDNRGIEGLTLTPDGNFLVGILQSPLAQDGSKNGSTNTRIVTIDVRAGSPTRNQVVGEYIYRLGNGQLLSAGSGNNTPGTRSTPISEILAISSHQFLVLERDSRGLGGDAGQFFYKRVVLIDTNGATNLAGTGYDLAPGTTGALTLPANGLPIGVNAVSRMDLVDMLDSTQLAKFGLNANGLAPDQNTLSEKWEGLALISCNDPTRPDDYFLLIGNDNDFKASSVIHNGQVVGTNGSTVDSMVLVYRVTLAGIPEPGSIAVFAFALAVLGLARVARLRDRA